MNPANEEVVMKMLELLDPFDWKGTWAGWKDKEEWFKISHTVSALLKQLDDSATHDEHHRIVSKLAGIFHLALCFDLKNANLQE